MAETLEELSYDYEEDGALVRKELDRVVLAKGAWPAVMFLYQERDRGSGELGAPRATVVRFRKHRGLYRRHSAFHIASAEQARQIAEVLERWRPHLASAAAPDAGSDRGGDDHDHDHDHDEADTDREDTHGGA